MKVLEVNETPEKFLKKVNRALGRTEFGKIMKIERKANEIEIEFTGLSTSRIWYTLKESEEGFRADFKKESISFLHKAFRGPAQTSLVGIMRSLGATITD